VVVARAARALLPGGGAARGQTRAGVAS
jgi:hypothetical protein